MSIVISPVGLEQLDQLLPLFEKYLVFYRQPCAPDKCRAYLQTRIERGEAQIFIARDGEQALEFVLSYPNFSSVSLARTLTLNDLYVCESARRQGVARQLITATLNYASSINAVRIDLSTACDNHAAQALYRQLGFVQDTDYLSYRLRP